jgi:hypothetical protein
VAEPEGPCAACAAAEAPWEVWRVLGPEDLVLAVPGVLASAAAERPGERIHVRTALEARGVLADHVDVHSAVSKLRRRCAWRVTAREGRPGYRLEVGPFTFARRRRCW